MVKRDRRDNLIGSAKIGLTQITLFHANTLLSNLFNLLCMHMCCLSVFLNGGLMAAAIGVPARSKTSSPMQFYSLLYWHSNRSWWRKSFSNQQTVVNFPNPVSFH